MADNEFDDDIDWSSIALPTPTVTPSSKRPRLELESKSNGDESQLLQNLEVAPTFCEATLGVKDPSDEERDEEEVGDELQLTAIKFAEDGKNVFLTGKAGTGKSWTTKKIVKSFNDNDKIIHVTAPTGIAAINIGGTTIHHWGRFRLGEYYEDFNNMMSESTRKKIRHMDALLIDEISMLDGHLFDVLECMISIIRHYDEDLTKQLTKIKQAADSGNSIMSDTMLKLRWDTISELGLGNIPPFGGSQLIVVGDFYQLSPIPAGADMLMENENLTGVGHDLKIGRQGSYAFESHAWRRSCFQTVELREVHRQAENDGLFECLNAMREGDPDLVTKHDNTLKALQTPLPKRNDGIIPTELHSKNFVVNKRNKEELHKLAGLPSEFVSLDEVELDDKHKQKILASKGLQNSDVESCSLPRHVEEQMKNDLKVLRQYAQEHFFEKDCRVSHRIEMKTGAQVMLLWNLEFGAKLANGSRGVVKGFFPAKGYFSLIQEEIKIREREEDHCGGEGKKTAEEESKEDGVVSNGKGDLAVVTPSKVSRDTSNSIIQKVKQEGFYFSGVDPQLVFEIKSQVANMGKSVIEKELREMGKVLLSEIEELPYISFCNGKRRIIRPQPFSKEFKDVGVATRWQIPLTLAWAISIHKSQGMTIECLYINLSDCFAIGQAYVACSRGKCLSSMTVEQFKPTEIKTSEKVKNFYHAINNGKPYTGAAWSDTIRAFDEDVEKDLIKKKGMKKHYNNLVPCRQCGTLCVVRQINTNRNNNQGKFYISCPTANGEYGHTWELVSTLPLKQSVSIAAENGNQSCNLLTPGVNGAIENRLEDKRFVLTGIFPELGGGFGLKIGKDKMKRMIESFGGKVTGAISGKTDFIIFGVEPGAKRLEDAKSKGIPTIDSSSLHKILMGRVDLPPSVEDASQPTMKEFIRPGMGTTAKHHSYDC